MLGMADELKHFADPYADPVEETDPVEATPPTGDVAITNVGSERVTVTCAVGEVSIAPGGVEHVSAAFAEQTEYLPNIEIVTED